MIFYMLNIFFVGNRIIIKDKTNIKRLNKAHVINVIYLNKAMSVLFMFLKTINVPTDDQAK